jgi:hypothetical protein
MATDMDARVWELESKVQELTDREALRNLRYRYHEYINEGKFADIAELFIEDGELEFGQLGHAKGREKVGAFFSSLAPSSLLAGHTFPSSNSISTTMWSRFMATARRGSAIWKPSQS